MLKSPSTVAILAQGTSWAVAVTQAFFIMVRSPSKLVLVRFRITRAHSESIPRRLRLHARMLPASPHALSGQTSATQRALHSNGRRRTPRSMQSPALQHRSPARADVCNAAANGPIL